MTIRFRAASSAAIALVLGVARARVQGQTLSFPLDRLPLGTLHVQSVSALDPSGWMRVLLDSVPPPAPAAAAPPVPGVASTR